MKLHRIAVRDYKGIRAFAMEPRESGVTIIEGENEIGKSSIAEALWLIFEQNDDSSSQLVRGLKPADRDAATEIEVEVSTGPYRFKYLKRFHRGSRTELQVLEPRRELLSGREAHNRARQILDETIDRALWEALRLQQGASLEPIAAGQHQSLLDALGVAAGALLGGNREQTLFERIEQEHERYFTSSGREKAAGDGPNAPRLRRAREEAEAEAGKIANRIASLEERAVRAAALSDELAATKGAHAAATAARNVLAKRNEERRTLAGAVQVAAAKLGQLESRVREISAALKMRGDAESAIAGRVATRTEQENVLGTLDEQLGDATSELEKAEQATAAARQGATSAREAVGRTEEIVRLSERELQIEQMGERLERIERHEPELRDIVAWLNECRVDRRVLQELATAEREVTRLEGLQQSEGASIEVTAPVETTIEIDGQPAQLAPGRALTGKVPRETTLSLPGGITVRIQAGEKAQEIERMRADALEALNARLTSARVDSTQEARDTWDERIAKEERRRALAEQMKADLRDLSGAELREKLARERTAIEALRASAGDGLPNSMEAAKVARDSAVAALAAAEAEERAAAANAQTTRSAAEHLEKQRLEGASRLRSLDEEIERAMADLARLRQEQDTAALEQQLREARATLADEAAALDSSREALVRVEDVSEELAEAANEVIRLEGTLTRANIERASIAGVLEDAGAEGLHGQLVDAEQRVAIATEELTAFERRAKSARTLYEAMRRRRDEARENYAEPLRREIETLGKRVLGESFGVELADDLRIAKVSRNGISLELGQLSVGLREQLSVLTRLACASLVSETGGAPVVLDDIFGWADPNRLAMLGPVLAEVADNMQVLLFTCSPGRFASVVPARVVSMPSGRVEERGAQPVVTVSQPTGSSAARPEAPARPATPQAAFDLFAEPEPVRT